jgi:hypothetical protein
VARLTILHGLPFVEVMIHANGKHLTLQNVLVDSGSAGTAFQTDALAPLGLFPRGTDEVIMMIGIGGGEAVIQKQLEAIEVGDLRVNPFTIQMGALDYGLKLDGILGADFLLAVGAQINFKTLTLS